MSFYLQYVKVLYLIESDCKTVINHKMISSEPVKKHSKVVKFGHVHASVQTYFLLLQLLNYDFFHLKYT